MAPVKLKAVEKSYGNFKIIHGVDLEIKDREFVVFVGPSGCGKSTLLRMIAGLEAIDSGDLEIGNVRCNDVAPDRRGVAMVFQSYALYPHMTVAENMGFALKLAGLPQSERNSRVAAVAETLQLTSLLDRRPRDLSGGQRQRVAIGRAIVRDPKVFLFDEPLSNLDAALRVRMRVELTKLHRRLNATMIYVTHDQVEAMTMADRIVLLNQGRVEQVGSPLDLYRHPRNLFVAGFLGSPKMNMLEATVLPGTGSGSLVEWGNGVQSSFDNVMLEPGEKVTLGVRPEHLALDAKGQLRGVVEAIEHLGDIVLLYLQLPSGETVVVKLPEDKVVAIGETLPFRFDPASACIFDRDGNNVRFAGPSRT